MALPPIPHSFLASIPSGSQFRRLETVDLQGTAAVIGVPPTVPGDIAIWLDYAGKLLGDSGVSIASLSFSGGMMPYHILSNETFTIPIRRQGLSAMAIDVEGLLVVDGMLIEVN
jgi:hypothetical protein